DLVPIALVEEEDRVDVAVAGVEDIGNAEPVAFGRPGDVAEDVRHARPRHYAILRAVVGCEAADGAEGALAALPERGALRVVTRHAHLAHAVPATDGGDPLRLRVEADRGAVELDQEDGARVGRKADVVRLL